MNISYPLKWHGTFYLLKCLINIFNYGNSVHLGIKNMVIDVSSFWARRYKLIAFPYIDTSGIFSFTSAWDSNQSLLEFPFLNTSNGVDFKSSWYDCHSLTEFPLLDTSNGINFNRAWAHCKSLIEFPLLDLSKGVDFGHAWFNCASLKSFPQSNLSSSQSFYGAWRGCFNLSHFPPNMFDNIQTYSSSLFFDAWRDCNLTRESVENILISIDAQTFLPNPADHPQLREITITTIETFILNLKLLNVINSLIHKDWIININGNPITLESGLLANKFKYDKRNK